MPWPFTNDKRMMNNGSRVIALMDMDCFECQIYQKDKPNTKGKPCVAANSRGRIVSVNYQARKFGITRFLRVDGAKKRCPKLQVLEIPEKYGKPDNSKLRHASEEVLDTIKEYRKTKGQTTILEYSPHDEFYLDLTEEVRLNMPRSWGAFFLLRNYPKFLLTAVIAIFSLAKTDSPQDLKPLAVLSTMISIAITVLLFKSKSFKIEVQLDYGRHFMSKLCKEVSRKTKMTASAGVSTNKFRAKLASSERKPNGTFALSPDNFHTLISGKKINEVPGLKSTLGDKLYQKFHIKTMKDLMNISTTNLESKLEADEVEKISNIIVGYDDEPVEAKEFTKAIHCGKTFPFPNNKNDPSVIVQLKRANFKRVIQILFSRFWKWVLSFIWRGAMDRALIQRKGKVETTLNDLSKEMMVRLKEEEARNSRKTNDLRIEIVYLTDPSNPDSHRTEMRTFKFNSAKGWNGVSKKAAQLIKSTTSYDEQKCWVTEVALTAKNWIDVKDQNSNTHWHR